MADTTKKTESRGSCFVCGAELGKSKIKNPITNSPRVGVCAYDGRQDVWTFDPAKFT